jgi:hypothetical protein
MSYPSEKITDEAGNQTRGIREGLKKFSSICKQIIVNRAAKWVRF